MEGMASNSNMNPRIVTVAVLSDSNLGSETTSAPLQQSWQVHIHQDGVIRTRQITDPFTQKDRDECRWYLESHLRRDAFDLERADRAVSRLKRHAKSLAHHLDLGLQNGDTVDLVVQDPGGTIYRLHWELLDDPLAWDLETVQVRVRRLISPVVAADGPPPAPAPAPTGPLQGSQIVNILHIAARDRGTDITQPTDISPYMALNILIRTSQKLKQQHHPVQLNITTIRPGSFKALRDHLEKIECNKTYDLVHLDLHGDATDADGAQLFFEAQGATKARGADEVARLLSRAGGIRFVVMNACRSGRADLAAAHAGNTAAVFLRNGAGEHVLAMSFEILSAATELFLDSFYTELLVGGVTFGRAAQQGRSTLRTHKTRPAMLDVRLPLGDWCCPVVYSALAADAAVLEGPPAAPDGTSADGSCTTQNIPIGRDFEVGALEKMLRKHRKAFVHGHMGVGKTFFLEYARRIWAETAFANTILSVDLASISHPVRGIRSLVQALWSQLPPGYDGSDDGRVQALLQHVQRSRSLIIIDGLDAIFTSFPSPGSSSAHQIGVMREFLKQLFAACEVGKRSMIVFAGRFLPQKPQPKLAERPQLAWLRAMFKTKGCIMQLEGLSMYESLLLCEDSARHSAVLSSPLQLPNLSEPGTRDDMELLCRLLLGIPSAISSLVRTAEASGISWRALRHQLTTGESKVYGGSTLLHALDTHDAFAEFRHIPSMLSTETFSVLLFLGLFWHQGPYDERLASDMVEAGVCHVKDDVTEALDFAAGRGYIQLASIQNTKRISFVHPIFTVYARTVLETLARRASAPLGSYGADAISDPKPGGTEELLLSSLGVAVEQSTSPIAIAVRYYTCITSTTMHRSLYTAKDYDDAASWFWESADLQLAFQIQLPDEATRREDTPFKAQRNCQASHFVNTLACFDLCLDPQRNLDPTYWPIEYFVAMSALMLSSATMCELSLFAGRYERLLSRLLVLAKDRLASDKYLEYCYLALVVAFMGVRHWHRGDQESNERWVAFAERAMGMCETVEPETQYKAVFRLVLGASAAGRNWPEGTSPTRFSASAEENFDRDIETMCELYREMAIAEKTTLSFDGMEWSLSETADDTRRARNKIAMVPPVLRAVNNFPHIASCQDTARMANLFSTVYRPRQKEPQNDTKRTGLETTTTRSAALNMLLTHGAFMRHLSPILEAVAKHQKNTNDKTIPHSAPTHDIADLVISDATALQVVDMALRTGNWQYLAQYHANRYKAALEKGEQRQAHEHLVQLVKFSNKSNDKNGSRSNAARQLSFTLQLSTLAEAVQACDKDTGMKMVDEVESFVMQPEFVTMFDEAGETDDPELQRGIFVEKLQNLRCVITAMSHFSAAQTEGDENLNLRDEFRSALARPGLPLVVTAWEQQGQRDPEVQGRRNAAFRLSFAVWEAIAAMNWGKGDALLDELEALCRADPSLRTMFAGGEKALAMMRAYLTSLRLLCASDGAMRAGNDDESSARLDELEAALGGNDSVVAFVAKQVQLDVVYQRARLTFLRLCDVINGTERWKRLAEAQNALQELHALGRKEPRVLSLLLKFSHGELEEVGQWLAAEAREQAGIECLVRFVEGCTAWFMVRLVFPFVAGHVWLSLFSSSSV
ncbi:hypothetical protein QBC39DRAFT_342360 [Podospora conica]|nr:hypothetical protein QBC39DRAFT_342360 [Schizothecium conicum]